MLEENDGTIHDRSRQCKQRGKKKTDLWMVIEKLVNREEGS